MRHPRRIAVASLLLAASAAWLAHEGPERPVASGGAWHGAGEVREVADVSRARAAIADTASRTSARARAGLGYESTEAGLASPGAAPRPNGAPDSGDAADPPTRGAGRLALGATGSRDGATLQLAVRDPDGPREVWLWRLRDGREAVVARTRSGADGAGAFPPVMRSNQELRLVATPAGRNPGDPEASRERRMAPRPPEPPWARRIEGDADGVRLRVTPTEADADVVLAGLDGEEFARFAPARGPHAARRPLELDVSLPADEEGLLVAHESSDGRRSRWRAVPLTGRHEPTRRR